MSDTGLIIQGWLRQSFSGAPSTGQWAAGTAILDDTGVPYLCTADGTPGTWEQVVLGGAGGLPVCHRFDFAYDTADILTGIPIYTLAADEVVIATYNTFNIFVTEAFDGTTPTLGLGAMESGVYTDPPSTFTSGLGSADTTFAVGSSLMQGAGNFYNYLAIRQTGSNALGIVLSQDGSKAGGNPGCTQGAGFLIFLTAVPTT